MEAELLEKPTTALTVTARAALALSSDQTRKDLRALVANGGAGTGVRHHDAAIAD